MKEIEFFLTLLRELQKIDQEFPLQYAVCLAEIAQDEGVSLTTLATRAGMPLSTVSRIVGALSMQRRGGTPYGLVQVVISPRERRKKELYLTGKGREAIGALCELLSAGSRERGLMKREKCDPVS